MSNNYLEIADAHQDGVRNKTFNTLGQRLNQDSADLKNLQDQINNIASANELDINQLNDKINTANSDIDNIENDITNIEDTLLPGKVSKVASTTVNNIPKFSSTNGDLKQSGVTIDDSDNLSAKSFISTVAQGTPPLQVTSDTKVPNLNADKLDDYSSADFLRIAQVLSSFGTGTGYIEIPTSSNKNLIIQWGNGTTGGTTVGSGGVYVATMPITFPKQFTTECVYVNGVNTESSITWYSCGITTLSGGTLYFTCPSGAPTDAANKHVKWWAFGW